MPVKSGAGMSFVICTGDGPVQMRLSDDGTFIVDEEPNQDNDDTGPCPWSAQGPTTALIPSSIEIAGLTVAAKQACGLGAQDPVARAKLSPYDSRGPPHSFEV